MSDIDLSAAEDVAADEVQKYQGRVPYRHLARAVVRAVAPLIEAAVREQVAREIERLEFARSSALGESWDGDWRSEHERGAHYGLSKAYTDAARIARGQS